MKAEVDENLPPVLARVLNAIASMDGDEVFHITDLVGPGTKDLDVFQTLLASGISVHITQDHHHRRPIERQFIASSGLTVFVLARSWESQNTNAKAAQLIRWWPLMVQQTQALRPGAILRVPFKIGKFEMVNQQGRRTRR